MLRHCQTVRCHWERTLQEDRGDEVLVVPPALLVDGHLELAVLGALVVGVQQFLQLAVLLLLVFEVGRHVLHGGVLLDLAHLGHSLRGLDGVLRVEAEFQVEAVLLDHVFRVVLQSELVIEHAAFEGESTYFDLLEAVLLLLVLLFLLGVLLADPGDHEHVADLELVLLARARVQPHDFLLDAVDEALGVEHAVQLLLGVHQVALSLEAVQFVEAVFLLLLPGYDGGAQPGDFLTCRILQPCVRNAVVIDSANGFREVSSHDDFTLDRTSNVIQRAFHDAHDVVVSFDLELEEHVERLV